MPAKTGDLLVVDDQMGVRRLISEALLENGYLVEQATCGREALEKLRQTKYSLIILDVKMPGMSGLETLHEIRRFDPEVPVVLMTAYEELDILEEAAKLGVRHYLCKPFDLSELRSLVERYVSGRVTVGNS